MPPTLLILGLGYSGRAIAALAARAGWQVIGTTRRPGAPPGVQATQFDEAGPWIARATHILATAPPGPDGDPVLHAYAPAIAAASSRGAGLRWLGIISTTGVYGDRGGGWVDEATEPRPTTPRALRRLAAERAWTRLAPALPLDILRAAGIYGPGRSVLDELRAGRARRIVQPGHLFGRIHVDDIAGAVLAATARETPGARILNLSDDTPAASADVVAYGAALLGMPPPPLEAFDTAKASMSEMALSFWGENRRVRSEATQAALGRRWSYPSYREGLEAIHAGEQPG